MINSEEILYIVDKDNNPLEPKPRHIAHQNGLWHRTTGIWVINSKHQVLCQKRSLKKDVKPGLWEAFFGGHLAPGQDYLESAIIEASEELGIPVGKADLTPYKVFKSDGIHHKEFQHVFALVSNLDILDFAYEKDEIDALKWLSFEEISDILLVQKDKAWVQKPWDQEVLTWLSTLQV